MRTLKGTFVAILSILCSTAMLGAQEAQQQATAPHFNYAKIPWGATAETIKSGLAAQGLTFDKKDEEGDLSFKGTLLDQRVNVIAVMAHDSLVKIAIGFLTPDHQARSFYRDMVETLTAKYGTPRESNELFAPPYEKGDGYEDQAIKLGKALFMTTWGPKGDAVENLGVYISEELNVIVSYESPALSAELKARKARKARAF